MPTILPYLRKGWWGAKIDLKDAYFHLPLGEAIKPYIRMEVDNQVWEFQAGCFGLNLMPQIFMEVMKTFEKRWRSQGLICFIYLDDILLLGATKQQVSNQLLVMVGDLVEAGFKINVNKSTLEPSQRSIHLGFVLHIRENKLDLSPQRVSL